MGRITATAIHLSLCVAAGVGYFLFVIPRWWELTGETSHTLGTLIRIATGVLVALAALPVVLTLLRTRAAEAQAPGAPTPVPAQTLRMWSAGGHVVAGVLIVATAIIEIWVSLTTAGPWLYGVYGGALTVAVLAAAAFYLSFVAEKPPALPKAKKATKKRAKADESAADESGSSDSDDDAQTDESAAIDPEANAEADAETETETQTDESAEDPTDTEPSGALRNKRPSGKSSHRLRRSARTGAATDGA